MPHQAFKRSGSGLRIKPMIGHRPGSGFRFLDKPGSGLAKPSSALPIPTSIGSGSPTLPK
ncbi:hypothetical protein A2U01_0096503, partial [Trifolium medium]|nr:hypothetical protein [Trifolium medium]